jgi:VWFA-related protein
MFTHLPFRAILSITLIFNLAAGPALLGAQQAPADVPSMTIRTNTRLVMVDVVVTDKKGQPIAGLKAEDFTVEENGKKQKVSVFAPPVAAGGQAQTPVPPGVLSNHPEHVGPAGPPTVLIIDAANSSFSNQAYARSQMLEYVQEQSGAGNSMAVVTLTDRLHVLQQFTTDPQVLMTAIKNFRPESQILQGAPPPPGTALAPDTGRPGGQLAGAIDAARSEVAAFANLQIGYNIERRTLITIDAMRSLTRMLGGLPGRKNVVWLTADLPFDMIPEDRNMTDTERDAELPGAGRQRSAALNGAGALAAESRQLYGQEIKDAESQLASASIAIYPVDLRGLVSGMESTARLSEAHSGDIHGAGLANAALGRAGGMVSSQDTMREVAAETGGKAYINQNEIKQGVALAAADDKASYSIGYYPENRKWDGKYRNIKVKVDQHDTEVRHRKGYFAVDVTQEKPNYDQDVAGVLMFNSPATQVSFMAQAKPIDPGKLRVVFIVDARTLSAEDSGGSKKMKVTLYATIFGADGKMVASNTNKIDQTFDAATYQKILDKGMMVFVDLDAPATGKQLRLAVLDGKTGFIGSASGPVNQ